MITLSLVIPIYNETSRLPHALKELQGFKWPKYLKVTEVIFVNDGSTDETQDLLELTQGTLEKTLKAKVNLISYSKNRGKGYAVKRGMKAATADYALLMDIDLSTPLAEIIKFSSLLTQREEVIIGTRKTSQAQISRPQPLYRQYLGQVFTWLSQLLLNTWVSDFTCGFKVFSRSARKAIFSKTLIERWGYDAEVLFIARISGYTIHEVPVHWHDDPRSKVSVIKASIQSLLELLQVRHNDMKGAYHLYPFVRTLVGWQKSWA